MNTSAQVVPKVEWEQIAALVHKEVFGVEFSEETIAYDWAVLVKKDSENLAYGTIEELDSETAYINFCGMFKKFKGQKMGYEAFGEIVKLIKDKYKRIGFTTKTKNTPMIKLGLNEGFEIIGMRKIYGISYLEFLLEKEN